MTTQSAESISYDLTTAAKVTGLSARFISDRIRARELVAKKAGAKTLIKRQDLDAWVDSLPNA